MADQPKPSLFGSTGAGATGAGTGLFGAPSTGSQPTQSLFGGTGAGAPALGTGSGGGSLFGGNSTGSSTLFGQPQANPATSTTAPQKSVFGQPGSTNLFGGNNSSAEQKPAQPVSGGGNIFGQPSGGAQATGFGAPSTALGGGNLFAPKDPAASTTSTSSPFGGAGFGAPPKLSGFGQATQPASSTENKPSTTGFGSQPQAEAPKGIFGSSTTTNPPAASTSLTSTTQSTNPTGFLASSNSLFGAPSTNLAAAKPDTAPTQQQPSPLSGFGASTAPKTTGASTTGLGFGSSTLPLAQASSPLNLSKPAESKAPTTTESKPPAFAGFGGGFGAPSSGGAFGGLPKPTDTKPVTLPLSGLGDKKPEESKPAGFLSSFAPKAVDETNAPKAQTSSGMFSQPVGGSTSQTSVLGQPASQSTISSTQQTATATKQQPSTGMFGSLPAKEAGKEETKQNVTSPPAKMPAFSAPSFSPPAQAQQPEDKKKEEEKKQSPPAQGFQGFGQPASAPAFGFQPDQKQPDLKPIESKPQAPALPDSQKQDAQPSAASQDQIQPSSQAQPAKINDKLSSINTRDEDILDTAINKWRHQIDTNEQIFQANVKQLNKYEFNLISSIEKIKKLEEISVTVAHHYTQNHDQLGGITAQQSQIINELDIIEKELDSLIEVSAGQDTNQFRSYLNDPSNKGRLPSREEVFKKAIELENTVDTMSRDLNGIQDTLNRCQNLDSKLLSTYDYKKHSISGGQDSQMRTIDQTLNIFYDTLKWIENAAVDLKFQVEEVETRLQKAEMVEVPQYQ